MHTTTFLYRVIFSLLATCATVRSQDGAVFVYDISGTNDPFVFALRASSNGNDLAFHMAAPAKYSYMSVGTGNSMDDSFMLVVYGSSNGKDVTISPRVAMNGNSEPSFYPSITCEMSNNTGFGGANTIGNSVMVAEGICHNVNSWGKGQLDLQSTAQPFIFAVGPTGSLDSDSMTAPMQRHSMYGRFSVNMKDAVTKQSVSVPQPNAGNTYTTAGSTQADDVKSDFDYAPAIHGVVMCLAFIILFPLGILLLRVLESVRWHWICQSLALILVVLSSGGGVYISMEFNRSRNFNTAHQVLGILLFLALLAQLALGWVHHLNWKKYQRPTMLGKVHIYLGPVLLIFGLMNAPLGFNLAGLCIKICQSSGETLILSLENSSANIGYIIVVVIVALIFVAARAWKWLRQRKQGKGRVDQNQYQYAPDYTEHLPLRNYGAPQPQQLGPPTPRSYSPTPSVSPAPSNRLFG